MRALLLLPFMALCLVGAAVAAEPQASMLSQTWQSLIDYGASAIAAAIVGAIAFAGQRLFGIVMEKSHRDALHSALTTGASLLISLIAEMIAGGLSPAEARQLALQQVVGYVKASVPDAIRAFKLGDQDGRVIDMLKAKEVQLQLGAAPPLRAFAPASISDEALAVLRSGPGGILAPASA
jgi:hypothetical protein